MSEKTKCIKMWLQRAAEEDPKAKESQTPLPGSFMENKVVRLGFCRWSLNQAWHKKQEVWGCLVKLVDLQLVWQFSGVHEHLFFPELRPDIHLLQKKGSEFFVRR